MKRLALLVLAIGALLPAGRVSAAPSTAGLELTSATAWVNAGGSFELHLRVGTDVPTDAELAVSVYAKVTTRSQFARTLEGSLLGRSTKQLTFALGDLAVDDHGNRVLSLPLPRLDAPPDRTTLPALRMGVYPVRVGLRAHGGDELAHLVTQLVRVPDDPTDGPLAVAWIQPIGARPVLDETAPLTEAELARLAAAIDAAATNPSLPMTLAVTPESLAHLDPPQLASLRGSLTADRQLLALPYVDVDVSAVVAAGRAADLATLRQAGDDALQSALGTRGDPRTWSSSQAVTAPALARLRDLGVDRIAVPESSLEPLRSEVTRGLTLTRPFDLAAGSDVPVSALAVDDALTAHFRSTRGPVLAAHDLLADLAVLFLDAPGVPRGVVVRPPADWHTSTTFLDAVLPALASSPILQPVTLDGLFQAVQPLTSKGSTVVRTGASSARVATLPASQLGGASASVDDLAALVGPSSQAVSDLRRQLLVAESRQLDAAARSRLLGTITSSFDEVRSHIRLRGGRTIRLTARAGTIPLTLVNDNPFPVRVDLVLSSDKLEFTDVSGPDRSRQTLADLVLQPGTLTRAVPVRARASAAFSLQAALHVHDGAEIARSRFTIISTVFSGVGVVLSASALLFLLLWWGSHWRTVRRDRRLVDVDH